jgi:branched-chain amino acid transport system ATP-binding protein
LVSGAAAESDGWRYPVMAILKVEGITKCFGGLVAVNGLDLEIEKGEIVGLIGPNGSGKTTIFNLLSGFCIPNRGRVVFKGEDITGLKPHEICTRGLARTFQIVQPFPKMTTIENVMVGGFCRERDFAGCLQKSEKILSFVEMIKKRSMLAEELTIADRKCLELARALATGPSLLLLDEIMAGLTRTEWENVLEIISSIKKEGVTILLIEHVMKAVMKISERIIVINHGTKLCEGKPEQVANNKQVISAYLGDQSEFTRSR